MGDSEGAGDGVGGIATRWWYLLAQNLGRPVINLAVGGTTSTNADAVQAANPQYLTWMTIIWTGTNDTVLATYQSKITAMVNRLQGKQRFIIKPPMIPAGATPNDPVKLQMRAWLAATYPNNYIDTAAMLATHGDGSANDLSDIANGYTPRSLTADGTHMNAVGQALGEAQDRAFILSKGWQ